MRPTRQRGRLLRDWLTLLTLHGAVLAGIDRNILARGLAENAG